MTPVDVSLWVSAYRSTPGSATGFGCVPGSVRMIEGSSRNGAASAACANLLENSPKVRCCDLLRIRPNVAMSQNSVAPPLPSTTS